MVKFRLRHGPKGRSHCQMSNSRTSQNFLILELALNNSILRIMRFFSLHNRDNGSKISSVTNGDVDVEASKGSTH